MEYGNCHLFFRCGKMKVFLSLLFLLLLFGGSQGSTLSHKRPVRALNTTLQTNFNGTYQRKNPCNNADAETSSYTASHEFHHHTKEDNWSDYTHKCSAIISSFLQAIGNLIRFNNKQNGIFNFHISTSICQKQDGNCEQSQRKPSDSLPTIIIEATDCEIPPKSSRGNSPVNAGVEQLSENRNKVTREQDQLICEDSSNERTKTRKQVSLEIFPTTVYFNQNQNPSKITKKSAASELQGQNTEHREGCSTTPVCEPEDKITLTPFRSTTAKFQLRPVKENSQNRGNLNVRNNNLWSTPRMVSPARPPFLGAASGITETDDFTEATCNHPSEEIKTTSASGFSGATTRFTPRPYSQNYVTTEITPPPKGSLTTIRFDELIPKPTPNLTFSSTQESIFGLKTASQTSVENEEKLTVNQYQPSFIGQELPKQLWNGGNFPGRIPDSRIINPLSNQQQFDFSLPLSQTPPAANLPSIVEGDQSQGYFSYPEEILPSSQSASLPSNPNPTFHSDSIHGEKIVPDANENYFSEQFQPTDLLPKSNPPSMPSALQVPTSTGFYRPDGTFSLQPQTPTLITQVEEIKTDQYASSSTLDQSFQKSVQTEELSDGFVNPNLLNQKLSNSLSSPSVQVQPENLPTNPNQLKPTTFHPPQTIKPEQYNELSNGQITTTEFPQATDLYASPAPSQIPNYESSLGYPVAPTPIPPIENLPKSRPDIFSEYNNDGTTIPIPPDYDYYSQFSNEDPLFENTQDLQSASITDIGFAAESNQDIGFTYSDKLSASNVRQEANEPATFDNDQLNVSPTWTSREEPYQNENYAQFPSVTSPERSNNYFTTTKPPHLTSESQLKPLPYYSDKNINDEIFNPEQQPPVLPNGGLASPFEEVNLSTNRVPDFDSRGASSFDLNDRSSNSYDSAQISAPLQSAVNQKIQPIPFVTDSGLTTPQTYPGQQPVANFETPRQYPDKNTLPAWSQSNVRPEVQSSTNKAADVRETLQTTENISSIASFERQNSNTFELAAQPESQFTPKAPFSQFYPTLPTNQGNGITISADKTPELTLPYAGQLPYDKVPAFTPDTPALNFEQTSPTDLANNLSREQSPVDPYAPDSPPAAPFPSPVPDDYQDSLYDPSLTPPDQFFNGDPYTLATEHPYFPNEQLSPDLPTAYSKESQSTQTAFGSNEFTAASDFAASLKPQPSPYFGQNFQKNLEQSLSNISDTRFSAKTSDAYFSPSKNKYQTIKLPRVQAPQLLEKTEEFSSGFSKAESFSDEEYKETSNSNSLVPKSENYESFDSRSAYVQEETETEKYVTKNALIVDQTKKDFFLGSSETQKSMTSTTDTNQPLPAELQPSPNPKSQSETNFPILAPRPDLKTSLQFTSDFPPQFVPQPVENYGGNSEIPNPFAPNQFPAGFEAPASPRAQPLKPKQSQPIYLPTTQSPEEEYSDSDSASGADEYLNYFDQLSANPSSPIPVQNRKLPLTLNSTPLPKLIINDQQNVELSESQAVQEVSTFSENVSSQANTDKVNFRYQSPPELGRPPQTSLNYPNRFLDGNIRGELSNAAANVSPDQLRPGIPNTTLIPKVEASPLPIYPSQRQPINLDISRNQPTAFIEQQVQANPANFGQFHPSSFPREPNNKEVFSASNLPPPQTQVRPPLNYDPQTQQPSKEFGTYNQPSLEGYSERQIHNLQMPMSLTAPQRPGMQSMPIDYPNQFDNYNSKMPFNAPTRSFYNNEPENQLFPRTGLTLDEYQPSPAIPEIPPERFIYPGQTYDPRQLTSDSFVSSPFVNKRSGPSLPAQQPPLLPYPNNVQQNQVMPTEFPTSEASTQSQADKFLILNDNNKQEGRNQMVPFPSPQYLPTEENYNEQTYGPFSETEISGQLSNFNIRQSPGSHPAEVFNPKASLPYFANKNAQEVESGLEQPFPINNILYPNHPEIEQPLQRIREDVSETTGSSGYTSYNEQVFSTASPDKLIEYNEEDIATKMKAEDSEKISEALISRQQLADGQNKAVMEGKPHEELPNQPQVNYPLGFTQRFVPYNFQERSPIFSPESEPPTTPQAPVQKEPYSNPLLETMETHLNFPLNPQPQGAPASSEPRRESSLPLPNEFTGAFGVPSVARERTSERNFVNSQDLQPRAGVDTAQDVMITPEPDSHALVPDLTIPSNEPGENHVSCWRLCSSQPIPTPPLCPFDPILKGSMTAPSYYILISKLPVDDLGEESFQVEKVYLGDGTPLNCTFSTGKTFPTSLYSDNALDQV